MDTVNAITILIKANHYLQALVILYAAIDTFAWAIKTEGDINRNDFYDWVKAYMDLTLIGCTAEDLYSARCALLHSGATESKMSRDKIASELWYITAPSSVPILNEFIDGQKVNAKSVYVTELVAAFAEGVMKFSDEIITQETRQIEVAKRIDLWLTFVPSTVINKRETSKQPL
jgi:hypothetical protein